MAFSFFFYDLETSGVNPRKSRIMQFAGQRTDDNLKPVGNPYNFLIKITDDVLPDPDAILITGITPQKTLQEGISEAEFCKVFKKEIFTPDTCFVGFNNIRFDDEFLRFFLYRNFCDPYGWQWENGCSRWDLLDVVRMTRALRPEGIKWPVDYKGMATNRLELLAKENRLAHAAAHDALSDVKATIAVADMIKTRQPKLFEYLKSVRGKKKVKEFIETGQPFVYSSGKYPSEYEKTTIVQSLGPHPDKQGVLVYDLRHDPGPFLKMNASELASIWKYTKDKDAVRLPVKAFQFNRCPAVAPLGVVDDSAFKRIKLELKAVNKHRTLLLGSKDFYKKLCEALAMLNQSRTDQAALFIDRQLVDEQLYDSFISDQDKNISAYIAAAQPAEISSFESELNDDRLKKLLPLYKARNFPSFLTDEERQEWEKYRAGALTNGKNNSSLARFSRRLNELAENVTDKNKLYLLEELRLYAESIVPEI